MQRSKLKYLSVAFFFDDYFSGYDDPDYTLIELDFDYAEYTDPESYSQGCNLKRY